MFQQQSDTVYSESIVGLLWS